MKLTSLIFCILLCHMVSTFGTHEGNITINIFCKECVNMQLTLTGTDLLRNTPKEIFRSTFDTSGKTRILLTSRDTLGVFLNIGQTDTTSIVSTPLHLEPGTNTSLVFQDGMLTFQGDLESINSYNYKILQVSIKKSDYINANDYKYLKSSKEEKKLYFATIRSFGEELFQTISNDVSLTDYYKQLLINFNHSSEITRELLWNSIVESESQSKKSNSALSSPTSTNIFEGFYVNDFLLRNSFYLFGLRQHIGIRTNLILEYYDEHQDQLNVRKFEYIKTSIKNNPNFIRYQDLVMALCITHISYFDGVDYEDLSQLIQSFEKEYPLSKYMQELGNILADHSELRSGMPMKDFSLLDVNDKVFKLSSIKGNIIYIDVWATWCGPCREEFKYSSKLSKKYSNQDSIKFLYVSVDKNVDSWKQFLKNNPSLKGTHGVQSDFDKSMDSRNIMNLYKITGIPRYILIGKDGKIIDYNAARPSQLVHSNYLDSLLSN